MIDFFDCVANVAIFCDFRKFLSYFLRLWIKNREKFGCHEKK